MIRLVMAIRNTLRQPRRTILLGAAITFGVIIISLALGFTTGMEKAVQANVTLFSAGHLLVNGVSASSTGRMLNRINDPKLAQTVKDLVPDAVSISPTAQARATVVFGSREQQLQIRGVQWDGDMLFSRSLILTQGDWSAAAAPRAIVLGAQSARRFGLGLGDSVFVKLSTASGQQNVTEYKLGAVYDDAAAGGMTTALVPLANLVADLNLEEDQYQSLAVFLSDAAMAESTAKILGEGLAAAGFTMRENTVRGQVPEGFAQRLQQNSGTPATGTGAPAAGTTGAVDTTAAAGTTGRPGLMGGGPGMMGGQGGTGFPGSGALPEGFMPRGLASGSSFYRISTITELSGQMGTVLGSVRWIGATIFAIMLILTAAGITNTYRMVLMERTKEIGMLRCIGFRRHDIFGIFTYEALLIAVAGGLAGILASLPLGLLIHLIPFDPSGSLGSALSRGRLIFSPDILSYALVMLSVMAASAVAVFGPARRASRLLPVEALRTTA